MGVGKKAGDRIVGDSPRNNCAKFQLLGVASILNFLQFKLKFYM